MTSDRPRIVASSEGPVLQIPAGVAVEVAAAIGRLLALRPQWAGPDRQLEPMRRALLEVEAMHARGAGFRSEPESEGGGFPWVTAADAAVRAQVQVQTMTRWARRGLIPGAHLVAGHGWFIPVEVLPELEAHDDEHDADAA